MLGASDWVDLLGTSLETLAGDGHAVQVAEGLAWAEGPAELSPGLWVFSDIPNNRLYRWRSGSLPEVWRAPADFANGNFRRRNGALLTCQHGTRSLVETTPDGAQRTLCDSFGGARLNSPNDVVETSDGSIWFTDPTYGILSDIEGYRAPSEQATNRVYRLAPDGTLSAEIDHLIQPNGLTFSPKEDFLYVADSGAEMGPEIGFDPEGPRDIWAFPVGQNKKLSAGRHLATVRSGVPDGLRCDELGNIWAATGIGLECISASGESLGFLHTAEIASNLCFGGPDARQMLLTLATTAWMLTI